MFIFHKVFLSFLLAISAIPCLLHLAGNFEESIALRPPTQLDSILEYVLLVAWLASLCRISSRRMAFTLSKRLYIKYNSMGWRTVSSGCCCGPGERSRAKYRIIIIITWPPAATTTPALVILYDVVLRQRCRLARGAHKRATRGGIGWFVLLCVCEKWPWPAASK